MKNPLEAVAEWFGIVEQAIDKVVSNGKTEGKQESSEEIDGDGKVVSFKTRPKGGTFKRSGGSGVRSDSDAKKDDSSDGESESGRETEEEKEE